MSRIAVVTGGNQGLGLEICRQLATQVLVVLTARDDNRGANAVAKLHASGLPDIIFHQLDVTDPASIASLANFIEIRFGKLDILVNNAGMISSNADEEYFGGLNLLLKEVGLKAYENDKPSKKVETQTLEEAQKCLETNYYGAKHVTQALLPLLLKSTSPRVVNISSKMGQLQHVQDENVRKILSDVDGLTEEVVDEVVSEYLKDAKDQKLLEKKGWTSNVSGYVVSKTALNAYTRILAKKFPSICANAVTPGFLATAFTSFKGSYTVEEGARGPVRLALLPDGGPSAYFTDQKLLEKKGWTSNVSGYIVSKVALNAYTRILAKKFPSVCVNAITPGFLAITFTSFKGTYTVEEGAKGPLTSFAS